MSQDTTLVHHDDAEVRLDRGATALDALKELELTGQQIVAARVDGEQWDLDRPLPADRDAVDIEAIPTGSEPGRAILRHSVAHLMAQAVTDLYPDAKWAIGPPIDDGFYYDFDVVLRTGCQWRALDATAICSGSTANDRFQEWQQAGFVGSLTR